MQNLPVFFQESQQNLGEQGREDPINLPFDDSGHSFLLGALSTEHPKSKITMEQISRSKVMTKIQLTAKPFHRCDMTIV